MHGPTREHVEGDPFQDDPRVVMPFSAYSPSGDVEAEVVYANYGRPEDFQKLKEMGVDVRGKIVLVRYGENFRGVKAVHGAGNRRRRHADLFRPDGRRIFSRRRLSQRPVAARRPACSAAPSNTASSIPAIPPRPAGRRPRTPSASTRRIRPTFRKFPPHLCRITMHRPSCGRWAGPSRRASGRARCPSPITSGRGRCA